MDIQLKLYDELLNRFYIDRNKVNIDCYKIFTMCDLIVVNMVFKNNYLHRDFDEMDKHRYNISKQVRSVGLDPEKVIVSYDWV
jgi:hypothetical protein